MQPKKLATLNLTSESSLHSLDDSEIEKVEDFMYLRGYINSTDDLDTRTGKASGALIALWKVWLSPIKKETKKRVFN